MSNHVSFLVGGCSGTDTPSKPRPLYGDNTSAFGLVIGERVIMIDNGSGAKNVARLALVAGVTSGCLLQTHYHGDHVEGLYKNPLLVRRGCVQGIWSPLLGEVSLESVFKRLSAPSNWPICPATFGVEHAFHEFTPGDELDLAGLRVRTMLMPHPGGSVAYRIETPRGAAVIATDVELAETEAQERFGDFISGSALVYLDCQYRESEYDGTVGICGEAPVRRVGWGHSMPRQIGAALARAHCLPKRLVLGHHDPARTDADLHAFEREACEFLSPVAARKIYTGRDESVMLMSFAYECATYEL